MSAKDFRLIGRGIYSMREAHRLTGVPVRRIRRWARGYHFEYRGRRRFSPPAVTRELPEGIGSSAITFADLLEVRFLNAFRERGVSWPAIRIASRRAADILGLSHPFSSRRFSTDGRTILAEFVSETGDEVLLDLVRNQYELRRIIDRYLHGEIDFGGHDEPLRWWPVRGSDRIVIDPHRALGTPIVNVEGVPTRVLARAAEVEGSIEIAAALFDVDPESVAEAVEFELSHRAQVRLFFDNCISVALARAVAELARAQDIEVSHLSDRFARDTRDEEQMLALRPEGWIIISGDTRISRGRTERAEWHESGLTAFFLGDGLSSKKYRVQATELVRWVPIIIETCNHCRPGSGYLLPFKGKEPKGIYEPQIPALNEVSRSGLPVKRLTGARSAR